MYLSSDLVYLQKIQSLISDTESFPLFDMLVIFGTMMW